MKLFNGPMWRLKTTAQDNDSPLSKSKLPIEVPLCVRFLLLPVLNNFNIIIIMIRVHGSAHIGQKWSASTTT